ncbi:MAG TPA: 6-pyruvoyl-tetrahydropterin synthase-related protein [Patescibacteria group bacterium]|nr:6-pyruvoyl-tetrahydropterin synthase-related protein [Patescibacteria group bacterium]
MANIKETIKKHWPFLVIFIFGLFVSWPLFRSGYFSHQDDLQIIRIFEMRKCFSDFQIPCRWVPDMGWGNGMPLFNFYGPLAYYLGAILSFVFGFIGSAKILFFMALIGGSFGMYLLIKNLWGKYAGLTSAILYMFAPYKALDIYVRGALSESLALSIIPFVLYFGYKAIVSEKKNYLLFSLTLFLFLITHNIMTVIFVPIVLVWMFYWVWVGKFKALKPILLSLILAFGMSAFFTLPAFLEKNLVQTESLTRFELDYRANFISVKQLFLDRVWGYGTSIPGPEGGMNFQIGWPYWLLTIVSVVAIFLTKIKKETKILVLGIFTVFLFSIFMTHNKSTIFWENISILQFFQFPWRFLSLSILTSSILGGVVVFIAKEKYRKIISLLIIILAIFLNWGYFRPREYYSVSDSEKLSGKLWDDQRKGALLDYLPKTALEPREAAQIDPIIISGDAIIYDFVNKSNKFSFNIDVKKDTQIEMPIFYFPNWEVEVNGKNHIITHDNVLGRISIFLPDGKYDVEGHFRNTLLRTFANTLSILSFIGLLIWTKKCK